MLLALIAAFTFAMGTLLIISNTLNQILAILRKWDERR